MEERWAQLEDFETYGVSSWGRVENLRRQTRLKPQANAQGIAMVGLLGEDGRHTTRSLARLVANAFLSREGVHESFDTPIHLDGDRMNCRLTNLMWRPRHYAFRFHRQFSYPEFRKPAPRIFYELQTREEFEDYYTPCTRWGLVYTDVIASYMNRHPVRFVNRQFLLHENY